MREHTKIRIEKSDGPFEQIDILLQELNKRSENDFYEVELKRLRVLFETYINGERNRTLVEEYRNMLKL